jgi:hypothetical protein
VLGRDAQIPHPSLQRRAFVHGPAPGEFNGNFDGLNKEITGFVRPQCSRPLQIDNSVDEDVGYVYTLWTELTRQWTRQGFTALLWLGWKAQTRESAR